MSMKVNLSSDSFFSQMFLSTRDDRYRLSLYTKRGSSVVSITRTDLEAIRNLIDETLNPIPPLTDTITFDTI